MHRPRSFVALFLLLATLLAGQTAFARADPPGGIPGGAQSATVRLVVDGDTLRVTLDDGTKTTVRLIGVNAPEVERGGKAGSCYGEEATDRLAKLLKPGREIWLESDVTDADRYDRLLRYVWVEKNDGGVYLLNEAMVRDGYAYVMPVPPDTARAGQLDQAESRAQAASAGLWSACPDLAASLLPTPTPAPTAVPPTPVPQPTVDTSTYVATDGCTYRNVDGVQVSCPVYADAPPPGATAKCNDGTWSFSQHRQGTCSHHGGVAYWL